MVGIGKMAFKQLKIIQLSANETVTSKHINTVQSNIANALTQVLGKDQLDSIIVKNVQLLPGIVNSVQHGLGRQLSGYIVIRNHGGYSVLTDKQDINKSPELLLYLTTPAYCVVDLLIF